MDSYNILSVEIVGEIFHVLRYIVWAKFSRVWKLGQTFGEHIVTMKAIGYIE